MPERCCHNRMMQGDVPISSLHADPVDFGFLSAARYFCLSFSEPDGGAWVTAILGSEAFFSAKDSPEKMRRALAVVHEMRTARRSTFRFSNPRCAGCASIVTEHERHLLQLVQHARARRMSLAASSAMLLCEGHDTTRVCAAARGFADLVGGTSHNYIQV